MEMIIKVVYLIVKAKWNGIVNGVLKIVIKSVALLVKIANMIGHFGKWIVVSPLHQIAGGPVVATIMKIVGRIVMRISWIALQEVETNAVKSGKNVRKSATNLLKTVLKNAMSAVMSARMNVEKNAQG